MGHRRWDWRWFLGLAWVVVCYAPGHPGEGSAGLEGSGSGQPMAAVAPKIPSEIPAGEVYRRVKQIAEQWLRPWYPAPATVWESPWNRQRAMEEFRTLQERIRALEDVQAPLLVGGGRSRMFVRWERLTVLGKPVGWETDAGVPARGGPDGEVILGTGELFLSRTDVSLPSRGGVGFSFVRYYRSHVDYDGPLGPGWDHNGNQRIVGRQEGGQMQELVWLTGSGAIRFERMGEEWKPEPGAFYRLQMEGKLIFIDRPDGVRFEFEPAANQPFASPRWRIARIASRHDQWKANGIRFQYRPGSDLLERVEDPFGNKVRFYHDENGRLRAVHAADLLVLYDYDPMGRLKKVSIPRVALGLSQAQDIAWEYRYVGGLRHWLQAEIPPGGRMEKIFEQEIDQNQPQYGRVLQVRLRARPPEKVPEDPVWKFTAQRKENLCIVAYQPPTPLPTEEWTFPIDQEGRVSCYPKSRTIVPQNAQWEWKYNSDGLLVEERRPLGGHTQWQYDSDHKDARFRGNLLQKEETARPDTNPLPIVQRGWRWKYHPEIALPVEAISYERDRRGQERILQQSLFVYDPQDRELVREQTGEKVLWTVRNPYGLPVVEWDGRGCARVYRYYATFHRGPISANHGGLLAERIEDASGDIVAKVLQEVGRQPPDGLPKRHAEGPPCQRISRFRYDQQGRLSGEEYPGYQVLRVWNKLGDRLASLDTRRDLAIYDYDSTLSCIGQWERIQRLKGAPYRGETRPEVSGYFAVQKMEYDALGRLVAWKPTLERFGVDKNTIPAIRYEYLPAGLLKKRITPSGTAVEITYDEAHGQARNIRLLSRNNPKEALVLRDAMQYDREGFLLSHKDANGEIYRAEPDGFGRAFAKVQPDGLRREVFSDGLDRTVQERVFDSEGQLCDERTYEYDASGRLVKVRHHRMGQGKTERAQRIDEWLTAEETRYDPEGNILARRSWREGAWEKFSYDGLGRLVWQESPEGDRQEIFYENDWVCVETQRFRSTKKNDKIFTIHSVTLRDDRGRPWCTIPVGYDGSVGIRRASLLHVDSDGNPALTLFVDSKRIFRFYNTLGLLEKEIVQAPAREDNRVLSKTENLYDPDGLLVQRELDNEPLVFLQPVPGSALVRFERRKFPQKREFRYDDFRRLWQEISPEGLVEEYAYGPDSRVRSLTRFHSHQPADKEAHSKEVLSFSYDCLGRLKTIEETQPNPKRLQQFRYDWQGHVIEAWDFAQQKYPVQVTRAYDNLGHILDEQVCVGQEKLPWFVYHYDLAHGVQSLQVDGLGDQPRGWANLKLAPDASGRVRQVYKDGKEFCRLEYLGQQEIAKIFPTHALEEEIAELDSFLEPSKQQLRQRNRPEDVKNGEDVKKDIASPVYELCYLRDSWGRVTASSMRVPSKQWESSHFYDRDLSDNLTAEAMEARFYEPQALAERRNALLLCNGLEASNRPTPIGAYLTRRYQYDHVGNLIAVYRGPATSQWPKGTELASCSDPLLAPSVAGGRLPPGVKKDWWVSISSPVFPEESRPAVHPQETPLQPLPPQPAHIYLASNRISTKAMVRQTLRPATGEAEITRQYQYDGFGRLTQYTSSTTAIPIKWRIRYDVLGRVIAMEGFTAKEEPANQELSDHRHAKPRYELLFAYDPFNRRIVKYVKPHEADGQEEKTEMMLYFDQRLALKLRKSWDDKQPWLLQGQYIAGTEPSKALAYYERSRSATGQPCFQEFLLHQDAARNVILSSGYDQEKFEVFDIASYWGHGQNSTTGLIRALNTSLRPEQGREERFAMDKLVDDKTASWFGEDKPGFLCIKLAQRYRLQALEIWPEKLPKSIRTYAVPAGKSPRSEVGLAEWEQQHAQDKVAELSQSNDQKPAEGLPVERTILSLGGRQAEEIVLVWDSCPLGISVREFQVFVQPSHPGDLAFSGVVYDAETGLYYHGARYRLPELGIFISPDPLGFLGGDHLYAFARNDPLTWHDPDGRFAHVVLGGITGGLFGAGSYVFQWWWTGEEWSWGRFIISTVAGAASGATFAVTAPALLSWFGESWLAQVAAVVVAGGAAGGVHGAVSAGGITYLETGDLGASFSAARSAAVSEAFWGAVGGAIGGAVIGPLAKGTLWDFFRIRNENLRGLATSTLTGVAVGSGVGAAKGAWSGYSENGWEGVRAGARSGALKGALAGAVGGAAAFGVGKAIDRITNASWDKSRKEYWKEEARKNPEAYSPENLDRMRRGLAPQRVNPQTGELESMELHHTYLPQRSGLPRSLIDSRWNLKKVWPAEHKAIDPFRN